MDVRVGFRQQRVRRAVGRLEQQGQVLRRLQPGDADVQLGRMAHLCPRRELPVGDVQVSQLGEEIDGPVGCLHFQPWMLLGLAE